MKIGLIIPCAYTPDPWFSNCMQRVYEETKDHDTEVIISEDGPIPQWMRDKYPPNAIVLKHEEPSGCGLARKRAIEVSTADWIGFLDSDDVIHRGWFNRITDAINTCKNDFGYEFYFINQEPNGHKELIDTEDVKYGNFSQEMVWSKFYNGPKLRACMPLYNPPLMMTPAEDLFMNVVYCGESEGKFELIPDILLTRYVRTNGLAWSTAADDRNRLKQMQVSLEYMRTHKRNEDIYLWTSTYASVIEQRIRSHRHISGYKWLDHEQYGSVHEDLVILMSYKCDQKCAYCANDKNAVILNDESPESTVKRVGEVLEKWDALYGLPNAINLSGGETTMIDPLLFAPIFSRYQDKTFVVFTNGLHIDDWLRETPDNVLFKLHLVDERLPLKYVNERRVIQLIVISHDNEMREAIESLKCGKLRYVHEHDYKDIRPDLIEKCRTIRGPYVVDIPNGRVYPCCGTKCAIHGTIEELPKKRDNPHCATCRNPGDNMTLLC